MKLATVARPPLVLAGIAAVGLAVATAVRQRAPEPPPPPAPEPEITCVIPEAPPEVPDNARYWSIDMDGDGTPELVALTDDGSQAIVVHAPHTPPIATIRLQFPGNPCASYLGIDGGRLTATDRGGPACEETETRRFKIRDGQLQTVTIWPTQITVVDN